MSACMVSLVFTLSSSGVYDKDILARCLAVNYLSVLPLLPLPDILCRRWTSFGRDSLFLLLLGVSMTL